MCFYLEINKPKEAFLNDLMLMGVTREKTFQIEKD